MGAMLKSLAKAPFAEERGYFEGISFSDFASDKFLGDAFCNAETINWPAAGVFTLC